MAFRLFTNANGIVAGGVVGLSTILQQTLRWEPALVQWAINIPLLVLGLIALSRAEGMRSLLGSLALPLSILVTRDIKPITQNPILAAVFGGLVYGVGLGLILSAKGSVGGYSLLARVVSKRFPITVSTLIFSLDALTIGMGAWTFGFDRAMYGLIAAFLMRKAMEKVLVGFSQALIAMIITDHPEPIRVRVLEDMDRGLTILPGEGGFTGQLRPVLMIVLSQAEVPKLRALVREADPSAFMFMAEASEVQGQGFRRE